MVDASGVHLYIVIVPRLRFRYRNYSTYFSDQLIVVNRFDRVGGKQAQEEEIGVIEF
jgi:hypothetical protein